MSTPDPHPTAAEVVRSELAFHLAAWKDEFDFADLSTSVVAALQSSGLLREEQTGPSLMDLSAELLGAVRDIRLHLAGPVAPDEEVRTWPLWAETDGIWCGDEECPLEAESSEIGDFREGVFTLNELHEAIGLHISARRDREADHDLS